MTALERTRSGQFTKENAYTLAEIEKIRDTEDLNAIIMPVDTVFKELPALIVNEEMKKRALNGNLIYINECKKAY